jgi:hypothetical protein
MPSESELYGLPEYFIDVVRAEPIDGLGLVRMYCGARKRDTIVWLYSVVAPAEFLMMSSAKTSQTANDAWNLAQFKKEQDGH